MMRNLLLVVVALATLGVSSFFPSVFSRILSSSRFTEITIFCFSQSLLDPDDVALDIAPVAVSSSRRGEGRTFFWFEPTAEF